METSKKFVPLEALDPVAAKHLLPGVKLQVSRRTFAQIAAEKYNALQARGVAFAASSAQSIDSEQARILRAAALATTVRFPSE